jgi:hypothetical protein
MSMTSGPQWTITGYLINQETCLVEGYVEEWKSGKKRRGRRGIEEWKREEGEGGRRRMEYHYRVLSRMSEMRKGEGR